MTTTILPSRPPYGSPSYSPNSRPVYYGGSTVSGATPYALSFATLGLTGTDGYVYDGTVSRIWTNNGATVLATASGSDTGAVWEDMSGYGNHATQTTTANRPVFYSAGGIQSLRGGTISGVDRSIKPPALGPVANFTHYSVFKLLDVGTGGGYACVMWDNANNCFALYSGTGAVWNGYVPGGANVQFAYPAASTTGVQIIGFNQGGAGSTRFFGASDAAFTATNDAAQANGTSMTITLAELCGAVGYPSNQAELVFHFCAAADLYGTATDTTIRNYISSTFGTW